MKHRITIMQNSLTNFWTWRDISVEAPPDATPEQIEAAARKAVPGLRRVVEVKGKKEGK